jgi:hypothetical protein
VRGRKGADRETGTATGISGKNSGVANLRPYKPGESGNLNGRPQGDGLMRKRLMKSFLANEKAAMAAMARRWGSTKYVQDMWELLAKLEGEMTKEAGEGARGISVIILQTTAPPPWTPRSSARPRGGRRWRRAATHRAAGWLLACTQNEMREERCETRRSPPWCGIPARWLAGGNAVPISPSFGSLGVVNGSVAVLWQCFK